jgi:hypothetical protein
MFRVLVLRSEGSVEGSYGKDHRRDFSLTLALSRSERGGVSVIRIAVEGSPPTVFLAL